MPIQRYSKEESLNRILRLLGDGITPSTDAPLTLPGSVYSEDEALSRLAELLGNSLDGVTYTAPAATSTALTASMAETLAGKVTNKFISPYTLEWSQQFGEIYTVTGTSMMQLPAEVWTKITGSFAGYADVSHFIFVQVYPFSDKLTIVSQGGVFLVDYDLSFIGSADVSYQASVHVGGTYVPQTVSVSTPSASGSMTSISGHGFVYVSGSSVDVDVRIKPSAGTFFSLRAGQLSVDRTGAE